MRVELLSGICTGVFVGRANACVETTVWDEIFIVSSIAAVIVQAGVG
jgi:hypothetical protein